jgi:hypothetical protein
MKPTKLEAPTTARLTALEEIVTTWSQNAKDAGTASSCRAGGILSERDNSSL